MYVASGTIELFIYDIIYKYDLDMDIIILIIWAYLSVISTIGSETN